MIVWGGVTSPRDGWSDGSGFAESPQVPSHGLHCRSSGEGRAAITCLCQAEFASRMDQVTELARNIAELAGVVGDEVGMTCDGYEMRQVPLGGFGGRFPA